MRIGTKHMQLGIVARFDKRLGKIRPTDGLGYSGNSCRIRPDMRTQAVRVVIHAENLLNEDVRDMPRRHN